MNQRLIYLPVLVLSFAMFGVFWWNLREPIAPFSSIEFVVLPLLAFSFFHYMGWLGVVTGMPVRAMVGLAVQVHAWMLGPMFVFLWSGAYFELLSTGWVGLTRFLLALALWSVFACWQLNRKTKSFELRPTGKFLAFLALPFVTIIFALTTPLLAIAGKL